MRTTLRQKLLTSTLFIGAAAIATPAWAQPVDEDTQENAADVTIDPDAQDDEGTEAIVVTGSRIQRRDLTSTSPLAVVQDEEFKLSGAVNVEQVINTLPQVIPGTTAFSNNPGGGVATLNLRGLGSTRTLVLVNGRRWMFFDPSQIVDLNTIPQFLIDSVDVVTGGASAVYGSDAIAGVVNFRLQDDLNGIMAGANYSITEEGDGRRYGAHFAVGSELPDGRGNVVAFAEYFNRGAVFQGDRPYSRFSLGDACVVPGTQDPETGVSQRNGTSLTGCTARGGVRGLAASGSSILPQGAFLYFGGANFNTGGAPFAGGTGVVFDQPGVSRTRTGADLYNYAPANYLMVPQERWLLGGYGEFEISDAITAFTEVTFVNNRVQNELAPTPIGNFFNFDVEQNCQFLSAADCNALRAADQRETAANAGDNDPDEEGVQTLPDDPGIVNLLVLRRITETGPRNSFDERNAFRALAGLRGNITEDFAYEAYYFYARTRNANIQEGNISSSAFQNALNGTTTPINIFGPNTLTPSAVDQITILAQNNEISNLQVASASVTGPLGNLGLGADDIGVAVGAEYRSVSSQFIPDTALASGDVIGFNAGQATAGGYNVAEAFAELRVPIIANRPFFHRLEVSGAFRYSDYSLEAVGGVETYAAGVEFAPIPDITLRGQYQRAVRAPNVGELFGGRSNGFPLATDPCAQPGAATDPALRQLCIQTGVPANRVGDPGLQLNEQIEAVFGGNPNLAEERSETYTAGIVLRPRFIPRLNVTVDFFDITVDNAIGTFGGGLNNTLQLCYNQIRDPNSEVCQVIAAGRNPAGNLGEGDARPLILNANVAALETRGVDVQVDYSQPVPFSFMGQGEARLNFFFLGTWLDKFNITPVVDQPDVIIECADRFGARCGDPQPEYKFTSRVSLIDGPATLTARYRFIGGTTDDNPNTEFAVDRLSDKHYFDLAFALDVTDNFSFTVGVNNVLDSRPQFIGSNQEQANTFPGTFDVLGRDYFVSANIRF